MNLNQESFVVLSITGLLFGVLFNPMSWIQSVGYVVTSFVLEPLHITPTLADQLKNAKYVPSEDPAVKAFDDAIKQGEGYLAHQGPRWINENVYVALVDENGNILDDYQVKIVNGKAVCYGKTPKVGGTARCGTPSVWVKVDKKAVLELYNVKSINEGIDKAETLFFNGHIDVYPKGIAFKYINRINDILDEIQ